jgi:hypothetical protein
MLTRRDFIKGSVMAIGAGSALPGCRRGAPVTHERRYPGSIVGASAAAGHRLRDGEIPPATEHLSLEVVVLGGGIAGLAAARELRRRGVRDVGLFELEATVGGNSLSGSNDVSAYPWGAHYLPLPSAESTEVIALLEELNVITGRDPQGLPIYDEYALCADPMERLFVNGTWQEGVIPRLDVSAEDRTQVAAFLDHMEAWRVRTGRDGKRAFAIPVERSSEDPEFRALDQLTMSAYLDARDWHAEPLRWYVNYCCRDDYGAGIDQVSAWAGLHYFAARNAHAANAAPNAVLTWPEGNGWLVQKMAEPLRHAIRTRHLVTEIDARDPQRVFVVVLDLIRNVALRIEARGAICALPRFVAQRVVKPWNENAPSFTGLQYSPWMVANLTLDSLPRSTEALAWDNVIRKSPSLGYVVATHQNVVRHPTKTVLTYYLPLDSAAPKLAREAALAKTHEEWCRDIVRDLRTAHPEIAAQIRNVDIWLWGHAMIRPVPGFISGETRRRMQEPLGALHFAHSDMSGISIFEEAYTHGTRAAAQLSAKLLTSTSL